MTKNNHYLFPTIFPKALTTSTSEFAWAFNSFAIAEPSSAPEAA